MQWQSEAAGSPSEGSPAARTSCRQSKMVAVVRPQQASTKGLDLLDSFPWLPAIDHEAGNGGSPHKWQSTKGLDLLDPFPYRCGIQHCLSTSHAFASEFACSRVWISIDSFPPYRFIGGTLGLPFYSVGIGIIKLMTSRLSL